MKTPTREEEARFIRRRAASALAYDTLALELFDIYAHVFTTCYIEYQNIKHTREQRRGRRRFALENVERML